MFARISALTVVSLMVASFTLAPFTVEANQDATGDELVQQLKDSVAQIEVEYEKFKRGNLSAGPRAQEQIKNLRHDAQELYVLIERAKN